MLKDTLIKWHNLFAFILNFERWFEAAEKESSTKYPQVCDLAEKIAETSQVAHRYDAMNVLFSICDIYSERSFQFSSSC